MKYLRHHPLVWFLSLGAIAFTAAGIIIFNKPKLLFGIPYIGAFLIIADFVVIFMLYLAYKIDNKTIKKL